MKKTQSSDGIRKPDGCRESDTITNLSDKRLATAGKQAAYPLILQCPMMQNPSVTGEEYVLITARMDVQGSGHYLHGQKVQKQCGLVSDRTQVQ